MSKKGNVTLKDIAQRVGTSTISVHRAIHGKDGISEELRRQILDEVEKAGYSVNEAAAALRRDEARIAVLLPKPQNDDRYFFGSIWKSIRSVAESYEKFKMRFEFHESIYGQKGMQEALMQLYDKTDQTLYGLITCCEDQESLEWLRRFARRGTYVATVSGINLNGMERSCQVRASFSVMGRLAADFLLAVLKRREGRILCLGESGVYSNGQYAEAFQRRIGEQLPSCKVRMIFDSDLRECCRRLLEEIKGPDVLAVMVCNARLTYTACQCLCEAGEGKALEEIPVIGTDVFEELTPFFQNGILLASIYQSARERGEEAMRFLYRMFAERNQEIQGQLEELPVSLVMRENFCFYL